MSTITDYTSAATQLPNEMFLGQLVCFTIREADVLLDDARAELAKRNLSTARLRKRLRPIDAFKKASNEIAGKFPRVGDEQFSVLVRPVGKDSDSSHRHIVLERAVFIPGQRRRLEYQVIGGLIYERGVRKGDTVTGDTITVSQNRPIGVNVPTYVDEHLERTLGLGTPGVHDSAGDRLRENFNHWCTHLDSHAVRTFVRDYLVEDRGAVLVKDNGGFYFVAQKHVAELEDLRDFVRSIGSKMHLIPLLDLVDQRDMIAESFITAKMDDLRGLQVEIGKILADPKRTITEATYESYVQQAVKLMGEAGDMQSLLDCKLDTVNTELLIFKQTILGNAFSDRVKQPKSATRATP